MLSGGYCKDRDEEGDTLYYTGDGGNDTLGTKEQIHDQVQLSLLACDSIATRLRFDCDLIAI